MLALSDRIGVFDDGRLIGIIPTEKVRVEDAALPRAGLDRQVGAAG